MLFSLIQLLLNPLYLPTYPTLCIVPLTLPPQKNKTMRQNAETKQSKNLLKII